MVRIGPDGAGKPWYNEQATNAVDCAVHFDLEGRPPISEKSIPTINIIETIGLRRAVFGDLRENIGMAAVATKTISRLVISGAPVYIISSPEYATELLVAQAAHFTSGKPRDGLNRLMFGNGLVFREGESHKQNRKELNPAFDRRHLVLYADDMAECAERYQARWRDGAVINTKNEMQSLAFDILGRTFFSKNLLEADRADGEQLKKLANAFRETPAPFRLMMGSLAGRTKKLSRAIEEGNQWVLGLIAERRCGGHPREDMLSVIMETRDEKGELLCDADVRDAVVNLISGAYGTTTNALGWMWYLLARYPENQDRLRADVDRVLEGKRPSFQDIQAIPFALQIVKETLRLFPVASASTRRAMKDIEVDGFVIPEGSLVSVSTYGLHRNPDVFNDPLAFRPERFTQEFENGLPRNAYMPFGLGPRHCIGRHYALLAVQMAATVIAQRVTLALASSAVAAGREISVLHHGFPLRVSRRPAGHQP